MRHDGAISPHEISISAHENAISPREISLREISLPEVSDAEAALRRRMRGWMEQYRAAVDGVQEQVFDVQMAKASREELEALHRVLQAEGLG